MSGKPEANPFASRAMIPSPADFFGRAREIENVLSRVLSSSKAQSLSLVGQRRIGKSSLFRRLAALIPERDPQAIAAYYDLEASRKLSAGRFFAVVLGRLARASGDAAAAPPAEADAWEALNAFLEDCQGRRRFVLLLDEFDTVTANPAFDADFFGSLRYLANNFDLAFVTSSYEDLTELCHAEEIRQSPFFNVFTTVDLGLMSGAETAEMLAALAARSTVRFGLAEKAIARELGGRYPFFVQMAASAAWELMRDAGQAPPEEVAARFRAEADGHFRYFVDHLPAAGRKSLLDLARGGSAPETARRKLARLSLIEPTPEGGTAFFSPAFESYLRELAAAAPDTPTADVVPGAEAATRSLTEPAETGPGSLVAGRYQLERRLGAGAFGAVWAARDVALGRSVAIKLLRVETGHGDEAERRARFVREARVLARLRHPNVVTVHDMGEWRGEPWIAMELVEGGTLAERIAAGRTSLECLSARDTARLARDAALGLAHAHTLGIVHRDVKPANLMIERDGQLRVGDFGIGKATSADDSLGIDRMTGDGRTVGTPSYMAPEQLRAGQVDGRADLYALGVVMFECLTGRRPFEGVSVASVVARTLTEDPPDPRAVAADLPEGLAAIVRRLLAREPDQRFATGAELAEALAPFV
jgi:serine/threonine-protein kinase